MAYASNTQVVDGITYNWIGQSEYGDVDNWPATKYFDCDDMWLADGATAPVVEVEKVVYTEAMYTAHIIGQDNRNAAAMSSAFGTKYKKYTF